MAASGYNTVLMSAKATNTPVMHIVLLLWLDAMLQPLGAELSSVSRGGVQAKRPVLRKRSGYSLIGGSLLPRPMVLLQSWSDGPAAESTGCLRVWAPHGTSESAVTQSRGSQASSSLQMPTMHEDRTPRHRK